MFNFTSTHRTPNVEHTNSKTELDTDGMVRINMDFFEWSMTGSTAEDPKGSYKSRHRMQWIGLMTLVLSYDDLCDRLKHTELGDGERYYKYLCSNLNAAARVRTINDNMGDRNDEFIKKVFCLVDHLDTSETRYYAFHAWIRVAATVFRPELRTRAPHANYYAAQANDKVLERIKDCLAKGLVERRDVKTCSNTMYWDFTAANQKLLSAWKEGCNFTSDYCWHRQNRELIEYIYKHAYGEVRAKVMLTIGTKVPTELAEKIFEFAMAAEEIPLNACFHEEEIVAIPEHKRDRYGGKTTRAVKKVRGSKYCHNYRALLGDATD